MKPRLIPIGEFRQHATQIIHEIEETKTPVVLTRHGVPVAEIRPVKDVESSLHGSVLFSPEYDPSAPAIPESDWESA